MLIFDHKYGLGRIEVTDPAELVVFSPTYSSLVYALPAMVLADRVAHVPITAILYRDDAGSEEARKAFEDILPMFFSDLLLDRSTMHQWVGQVEPDALVFGPNSLGPLIGAPGPEVKKEMKEGEKLSGLLKKDGHTGTYLCSGNYASKGLAIQPTLDSLGMRIVATCLRLLRERVQGLPYTASAVDVCYISDRVFDKQA